MLVHKSDGGKHTLRKHTLFITFLSEESVIAEVCSFVAFLLSVNVRKFWLNVTDSQRAEKSPSLLS